MPQPTVRATRAVPGIAILGSLLLSSGCVTTRRVPVVPIPVRLVSPTPFSAHVRANADTAATQCQVLSLSGTVAAVRGDTLEFAAVRSDERPRGAADCLGGRPGFVVLSSAPAVRAEVVSESAARTGLVVLLAAPLFFLLAILVTLQTT